MLKSNHLSVVQKLILKVTYFVFGATQGGYAINVGLVQLPHIVK